MSIESKAAKLQLIGGALCLDFANTVGDHRGDQPSDHLATYLDLVAWSGHAGILNDQTVARLQEKAERRPSEAREALRRAVALREAIFRVFAATLEGSPPKPQDVKILNRYVTDALARGRLVLKDRNFALEWGDKDDALDQMLGPIARSAADLLTSGELVRVRECGGESCGWLFVDQSKNHSRRWCAMNDCGNRAKAHRHYKRMLLR